MVILSMEVRHSGSISRGSQEIEVLNNGCQLYQQMDGDISSGMNHNRENTPILLEKHNMLFRPNRGYCAKKRHTVYYFINNRALQIFGNTKLIYFGGRPSSEWSGRGGKQEHFIRDENEVRRN